MSQSEPSSVVEMSVDDAYRFLQDHADAQLVDVRTHAEWSYVGVPDLPFSDADPIFLRWQIYPDMNVDASFTSRLDQELTRRGLDANAPLLFLCRSGARSRSAAAAMIAAGHRVCVNVTEGFEGPLDAHGHRGAVAGWRAAGLPWRQS